MEARHVATVMRQLTGGQPTPSPTLPSTKRLMEAALALAYAERDAALRISVTSQVVSPAVPHTRGHAAGHSRA